MTLAASSIICRPLASFSLIHRYSHALMYIYRVNHFSEKEAPEGGKCTSTSSMIILYHLAHSPSHPHLLTLSDDATHNLLKSWYYADYYLHTHPVHLFRPSFAATSQTLQFMVDKIHIVQNFPNLVALLTNLDDFFQKISHRNTVASTKMWPFPLRIGVILKPLQEEIAPTRAAAPLERPRSLHVLGKSGSEERKSGGMHRDPPRAGKHSLQWKVRKNTRHFNVAPALNPRATGWI